MKWNNLKNVKCPACGSGLKTSLLSDFYFCVNNPASCDFKIGKEKYDSVVNNLYKPRARYETQEDNLSALNNLGHKEYSQDYSDEIEKL